MSSDGTTAVQVSPIPTESEMTRIRQIFEYAANAIVRASELGKQVTELEGKFETLNRDYTSVMARNDELITSLNEVRLQRDEAQAKLIEVRSSLNNMNFEFDKVVADAKAKSEKIEQLHKDTASSQEAYASLFDEWDRAQKEAKDAQAKLKAIHQTLGIPEPKAEIAPQAEPMPTASEAALAVNPEPRPLSEEEAKAPPMTGSEVDYTKPYHWDTALNRWVND